MIINILRSSKYPIHIIQYLLLMNELYRNLAVLNLFSDIFFNIKTKIPASSQSKRGFLMTKLGHELVTR